eukprot:TRINITY_DN14529_c0_g2_i1.p1 TRINITY_DN14529_c0_g2~~TRINITY_DN14529_c0_g2_i1.p1  ORF type:complete len:494 (-),score=88.41 TRINITY_DN14529_c0_g2_i1:156-1595(-)
MFVSPTKRARTDIAEPSPHKPVEFAVASGAICFGAASHVKHGGLAPIQIPAATFTLELKHNFAAVDGHWKAYPLVCRKGGDVRAWFACHSDVDRQAEIKRILEVSGAPREAESGAQANSEETFAQRVLIVNRDDWGDDEGEADGEGEQDLIAGLVDYMHAAKESPEGIDGHGVWLHIPGGEQMYMRLGLTAAGTSVHSFLFFEAYTRFCDTAFAEPGSKPLRETLSPEEQFRSRFAKGEDFEGYDKLDGVRAETPSELLGPFAPQHRVFSDEDITAAASEECVTSKGVSLAPELLKSFALLTDELLMSYVVRCVVPALQQQLEGSASGAGGFSAAAAAADVCPDREDPSSLDHDLHEHLITKAEPEETAGDGRAQMVDRLRCFILAQLSSTAGAAEVLGTAAMDGDTEARSFLAGLRSMLAHLLEELLDAASGVASDCRRPYVVPSDLRLALASCDAELLARCRWAAALWHPQPGTKNV